MHRVFKYPLKVFVREREREKKHKTRGRERFYGDKLEGKEVKQGKGRRTSYMAIVDLFSFISLSSD